MKTFHSPQHERLARAAIDDSRLMLGENPESNLPEDARHWLRVYGELAQFKRAMLDEMYQKLPGMSGVTAAEVQSVDIVIIREQLKRYERRIEFLEGRASEVARTGRFSARSPVQNAIAGDPGSPQPLDGH